MVVVVVVMPLLDGGSVEGIGLYVYGSVAAVGRLTKGDTVRGIWARRGCVPVHNLWLDFLFHGG